MWFTNTDSYFGRTVSGMGDLNGDGAGDVVATSAYYTQDSYLWLSESF